MRTYARGNRKKGRRGGAKGSVAAAEGGGEGGRADFKKTPWTEEEDELLRQGVREHGRQNWAEIALALPGRGSKSCRLRWCQHLAPELDSRPFTPEEDECIVQQQRVHGNKWATIARHLPGRSDNAVKNRWNSALRKQQGADGQAAPVYLELFPLGAGGLKEAAPDSAEDDDAATGLTLGLPGLREAELALSLWPVPVRPPPV